MSSTSEPVCSSRGCRSRAIWALRWNNPRLHPPQRRKTWLACPDHRDPLSGFLQLRGMLRETLPVDELPPDDAPRGTGDVGP